MKSDRDRQNEAQAYQMNEQINEEKNTHRHKAKTHQLRRKPSKLKYGYPFMFKLATS